MTVIGSGFDMLIEGNKCDKGKDFAKLESSNPSRTLTTTVRTKFPGVPVISVRTSEGIPRNKLMDAMKELSEVMVDTELGCGDVVVEDIVKTGVSVIVTSCALMQLGAELENKNVELSKRGNISASESKATQSSSRFTNVMNPGVVDDLGAGAADGFVGAAGEAVGVDTGHEEDEANEQNQDGTDRIKMKSRPHIKR